MTRRITNLRNVATIVACLAVTISGAQAQNAFFPSKVGTVLTFVQKNANGKAQSYTRQTIKSVEGSGKNMTISYVSEQLDRNKNSKVPPSETPMKVTIKNGVMIMDMSQFITGDQKVPPTNVEITGVPMELPSDLQVGQTLKDADVTMTVSMGFIRMATSVKMTDGKCLAIEELTTEAGTFKCSKITQTVTTTVMRRTVVSRTVTWYAPGVGAVKTETYDSKDKLQSTNELVEISK